jgi:MerR-like DNA binding protein
MTGLGASWIRDRRLSDFSAFLPILWDGVEPSERRLHTAEINGDRRVGATNGLATSALRYYERVGLLVPDGRANGRRYYGPASAERIALIRFCQQSERTGHEPVFPRDRECRQTYPVQQSSQLTLRLRAADTRQSRRPQDRRSGPRDIRNSGANSRASILIPRLAVARAKTEIPCADVVRHSRK